MTDPIPPSPTLLERLPGVVWFFAGMLIASLVVGMLLALAHSDASGTDPAPSLAAPLDTRIGVVSCPDETSPKSVVDAAACGDTPRLKALLANGADPGQTDPRPEMSGRTALHHAAQRADETQVALLLAAGAIPDLPDTQGNTPLHLLALDSEGEHPEYVARQLLEAGARTDVRNINGRTPIEELEADHTRLLSRQDLVQALVRAVDTGNVLASEPATPVAVVAQAAAEADTSSAKPPAPAQTPQRDAVVDIAPAAPAAPSPAADAPAEPPVPPDTVATPAPAAADAEQAVRDALRDWAQAWAAKDMAAYFARYHEHFTPEGDVTRQAWMRQRQARIGDKPGKIRVELHDITIALDGDRASARFTQDYSAPDYRDSTRKHIELTRTDERWLIVREQSVN